jgi:hypothetical protein
MPHTASGGNGRDGYERVMPFVALLYMIEITVHKTQGTWL